MVIIIVIAYICMYVYQYRLLKRHQAGSQIRRAVFFLFLFSLIYSIIGYFNMSWINPNHLIAAVFGPVQHWIQFKTEGG